MNSMTVISQIILTAFYSRRARFTGGLTNGPPLPTFFGDASTNPNWGAAIDTQCDVLIKCETWIFVYRTTDTTSVPFKETWRAKQLNENGTFFL